MKRKFEEELIYWKEKNIDIPLMVVGARQIGKTYLIKDFCEKNFEDFIYINLLASKSIIEIFESDLDINKKIERFCYLIGRTINENTVIFFDEIQESESLISDLKFFCETDFPYKIVCAGSLLGVKLKGFSKSFPVGKVIIKYMYPMDFEEFLMATDNDILIEDIKESYKSDKKLMNSFHDKALDLYRIYLCIGGMPLCVKKIIDVNLNLFEYDDSIITSIVDSYIADMGKYAFDNSELIKIEKIYKNIPEQLLKENKKFMYAHIEKSARKREFESSLDWLIAAKLVYITVMVNKLETPLKAFDDNLIFKVYLSDVGILTKLLELDYNKIMSDENFMLKGALAENFVAFQLTCNKVPLHYWAKNQVAEMDFLIDSDDGIVPIEVKAGNNVTSNSLKYYKENFKPKYMIRISTKNFGFENDIKNVPLYATFCINNNKI